MFNHLDAEKRGARERIAVMHATSAWHIRSYRVSTFPNRSAGWRGLKSYLFGRVRNRPR